MAENRRLARYFNKSAALVQNAAIQFELQYARPAYQNIRVYFEERPILSTFVSIFTLLSLIPVAFFAGAAFFVFTTFTLISLFIALFASLGITLFCFGFLTLVLAGTLLLSLFLTGATLVAYSLLCLAVHIQTEGPSTGLREWATETIDLLWSKPKIHIAALSPSTISPAEKKDVRLGDDLCKKGYNGPGVNLDHLFHGLGEDSLTWKSLGLSNNRTAGGETEIKQEPEKELLMGQDPYDTDVQARSDGQAKDPALENGGGVEARS